MKRLIAWLFGGKLVYLKDHDGSFCTSIAYPNPFGGMQAKRWWPHNIGDKVVLLPDGTCRHSYVEAWKYVDGEGAK